MWFVTQHQVDSAQGILQDLMGEQITVLNRKLARDYAGLLRLAAVKLSLVEIAG